MARLLPDTPLGAVTSESIRLHSFFKKLPADDCVIWHRLSIWSTPGPDFWILRKDGRTLLLKVSQATPADVRASLQDSLFQTTRPVGEAEREIMADFIGRLDPAARSIKYALAFPNVGAADLAETLGAEIPRLAKEHLTPDDIAAWLDGHLGPAIAVRGIASLRRAFTPETVIPPEFTVRQPIDRNTDSTLTEYLLDYNQEWALKSDLDLPQAGRSAASDYGLRLINGVAGSGKSLIIVYRAHLLRKLYPDKRMLVLTHNRPLIHDLESRYRNLSGGDRSVEWRTFHSWCSKQWPKDETRPDMIGMAKRNELVTRIRHAHLAETSISAQMFQDEIDWVKDRQLFGREQYLAADRSGRGFALSEAMRDKVFAAMVAYHGELETRHKLDWGDVPRRLWRWSEAGKVHLPEYDVVMIDEAQFFAPIWFDLIKKIIKPQTGHLFLVADPTQGFLKRRQSWLAVGLAVRGRTYRLSKSYRTTRQILNFATLLYRSRLPQDDDDIMMSGNTDLLNMPTGAVPMVAPLTSEQDEISRTVNEIKGLVQNGVPLGHMLIIHADWRGEGRMLDRLRREFGQEAVIDPKNQAKGNHLRVCTLNSATGIESPIVFLCGVRALYEAEQSLRLSEDERAELIRDNTRKLYMAITRAGQRLILTYVGDLPDDLKRMGLAG